MNKGKKSLLALGAIAAFGVGAWGINTTFAAEAAAGTKPMSNLVQAIAVKFNLNEADVQAVFDAERAKMEEQHVAKFKDRLAQAVTDGKLTQAQADAIVAKQAEEKAFFDSLKDMTEEERKAALKTHLAELKSWLENNKFPKDFAFFGLGHGHRGGPGKHDVFMFRGAPDEFGPGHRGEKMLRLKLGTPKAIE